MGVGVVDRHRLESSGANRQREIGNPDATLAQRSEDRLREVEAGGRRRDREGLPREDGLVGGAVLGSVRGAGLSPDVGREGSAADAAEQRRVERSIESHGAPAVTAHFDDFPAKALVERDPRTRLRASAGLRERVPVPGAGILRRQKKDLDEATLRVAAVEPRGPHGDVVAHEKISCPENLGYLLEPPVLDRAACSVRGLTGGSPLAAAPPARSAPRAGRSRRGRRARAVAYRGRYLR